jgi:assimilatory nitrate reductase electron transfer subunit
MIVCHCKRVPGSVIEGAVADGATTVSDVSASCQAGTRCGSCVSTIEALLAAISSQVAVGIGEAAIAA